MLRPIVVACVFALGAPAALAFNSVPGHAGVGLKAGRTAGGLVRSAKLTFQVRSPNPGWPIAFPALMDPAKAAQLKQNQQRVGTINPDQGYIRIALPHVDVPPGQVIPVEFEIDYDQHGLASGQKLTLVTAWPGTGAVPGNPDRRASVNNAPHVYGTITQYNPGDDLTLP